MEIPTKQDLVGLIDDREGPHVSLYLPTHRYGPDTQQDRIRLKNLLSTAEDRLAETGMRRTIAKDMLAPVIALEGDAGFWQHQSDGLAIFVHEDGIRQFSVPHSFGEMAFVLPRFHVKPLLPLLSADASFHVLAISSNRTLLLACTANSQDEVKLAGMPKGIADVLWQDDTEKQNQFRSFSTGASGSTAMFHGAGGEPAPKDDLLRYFREVDKVLTSYLRAHTGAFVLACVDYLAPIYREANSYAQLLEANISGSPDQTPEDELRQSGWQIVRPIVDAARQEAVERYRAQAGTGRTTSDPGDAVLAATTGRVDTAFVTIGMQRWGRVDREAHKVETHDEPGPEDYDLLDMTAAHTLQAGGTVYAVEPDSAPEPTGVAAVFRY